MYECSRCAGKGTISAFRHVIGGICFKCNGTGKQKTKPSTSIKWVVIGRDRATDECGPLYNVKAKTAAEAVKKARTIYSGASSAFKDQWTLDSAEAVPFDEYHAAAAA